MVLSTLLASCSGPPVRKGLKGRCPGGCLAGFEPELELLPPGFERRCDTQLRPCEWCGSCHDCQCGQALAEWALLRATQLSAEAPAADRPQWWSRVDLPAIKSLEEYTLVSRLTQVRIIRHAPTAELDANTAPWSPGQSLQLYEEMGMRKDGGPYAVSWLNMGAVSLCVLSEVEDPKLFQACVCADDFLTKHCKLVPGLMKAKFPLPSPGPELAETVGSFFGMQNVGCHWEPAKSGEGLHYACIHVDLYSRWYVRMGMQNGCFRAGNVVELLLVDAPQKAIITAFRLSIDQEFVSKVT